MAVQNKYLDEAYQNKLSALDKEYEAAKINNEYQNNLAKANQKTANRKVSNSYMKAVNPYGYNAEKLASSGLTSSGAGDRQNDNFYSEYQRNLGNNAGEYLSNVNENNNNLLKDIYQTEANKLSALGDYNTNIYDEYWRLTEQEYQKQRDKTEDKQWEKEYNLSKKQNSL